MTAVHRQDDPRTCGATTVVTGQSTVYVNLKLVAVEGDQETHTAGNLVSVSPGTVLVGGKKVIAVTDHALADGAAHAPPDTYPSSGSPNVFIY